MRILPRPATTHKGVRQPKSAVRPICQGTAWEQFERQSQRRFLLIERTRQIAAEHPEWGIEDGDILFAI